MRNGRVMWFMRLSEEMEYEVQAAKAGAFSTQFEGRVGNGSGKVAEKLRFRNACDTGWNEAAEEGPRGEGGGAIGFGLRVLVYVSRSSKTRATVPSRKGRGRGWGRRRRFEEGAHKVPA